MTIGKKCIVENPSPWQPIETAPKDGTEFIGINDRCGKWSSPAIMSWGHLVEHGGINSVDQWWRSYSKEKFAAAPTMWMPIPEPPKLEDE